jgi:hypothetical protein
MILGLLYKSGSRRMFLDAFITKLLSQFCKTTGGNSINEWLELMIIVLEDGNIY